jgi:hypothetical protein
MSHMTQPVYRVRITSLQAQGKIVATMPARTAPLVQLITTCPSSLEKCQAGTTGLSWSRDRAGDFFSFGFILKGWF